MYKDLEEAKKTIVGGLAEKYNCEIEFCGEERLDKAEIYLYYKFKKSNKKQRFSVQDKKEIADEITKILSKIELLSDYTLVNKTNSAFDKKKNKPAVYFLVTFIAINMVKLAYKQFIPYSFG